MEDGGQSMPHGQLSDLGTTREGDGISKHQGSPGRPLAMEAKGVLEIVDCSNSTD
jgi:hypothetical protein